MLERRKKEPMTREKEMAWHYVYILSELRAGYSLFDNEEWEYYHALSEAIGAIKDKYNLE